MPASDHTRLVNMFIGLCTHSLKWPHSLRDLGYEVELIEPMISMRSSDRISPDAIAVSNRASHAIVADCKGGMNIRPDQDERYRQLEPGDLARYVAARGSDRLGFTVCYVINLASHERLGQHTALPFIAFDGSSVRGLGKFGEKALGEKLRTPIPLDGTAEPTSYYPFSPDDGDRFVIQHVLRETVSYFMLRGTRRKGAVTNAEIARGVFDLLYESRLIGSRHRGALVQRIERIIGAVARREKDFGQALSRLRQGERSQPTLHKLSSECDRISDECSRTDEEYGEQTVMDSYRSDNGAPS